MHAQKAAQISADSADSTIMPETNWSVAIDSIGSAGIALVSALKQALQLSQQEIARRLLQAPSVLAENLSCATANQIADYLKEVGLEARTVNPEEKFEAGCGGFEVAIIDIDFKQMPELLRVVVELTGVPAEDAVKLLNKSPAIILANISENNACVLQKRFAEVGAVLAVSEVELSTYDVLLVGNNHIAEKELLQLVKTLRLSNTSNSSNSIHNKDNAIAIQGLDYAQAQEVWQLAQERRINCRLLNRDYQRYDIRLETAGAESRKAVADYLVMHSEIPEKIVDKVVLNTPVTIAKNKTLQEACELVEGLHAVGAEAIADLMATLNFDIEIENPIRPDRIEELLVLIGGLSKTHYSRFMKGKSKRVDGPLNYHQARWLQYELSKLGCKVSLKKRK